MAIHHPHSADEHLGFVCESCERIESRLTELELQLMFIVDSMVYAAAEAIEVIEEVAEEAIEEIEETAEESDGSERMDEDTDSNEETGETAEEDAEEDAEEESSTGHEEITPDVPLEDEVPKEPASREHAFLGRN